ncbi:actin-related protein 6 [Cylas formicarius]|uniref:actin-related protein 6 n=1 Tax=Cylas formicarius TaxID=197179 RepID=UPI002958D0E1|nr:actin-related protein 6 [Cylas formicarius]XP_060534564.1 actin-related protein 6 [Cylas formicarius]
MSHWELKSNKNFDKTQRYKRRRSSGGSTDQPKEPKIANLSAIIVDSGAYSIKIGHSTDHTPVIVPNCIMKAKSERKRLFIGSQINECRDCSGLYFLLPCERGYVTRWEIQKPIWDHVFSRNVCPINDNPVVLTQPLFNFKSIQDCIDEIFFEEYEVASLFRLNPTDLACLRYTQELGKRKEESCLIVDTGFSFTHIIPYINGNKYLRGIRRLNVGGKLLTNHLKDIISYRQYNVMEETYVINQVKEDTCYVCMDIKDELVEASKPFNDNRIMRNYVLPDFNNIRRGFIQEVEKEGQNLDENCQILRLNNERFVVPEILFHPSDIGMKSMGVAEAAMKSIFSCPKDHQEKLARNIVLIGGSCNFPGFKERMFAELRSLLPDLWQINVHQPDDPVTYSWQGGDALLKTADFNSFLVTREEYEELGSSIIQQRFNNWMTDNSLEEKEQKIKKEPFSYLEKVKSRSIFGKQEPNGSGLESKQSDAACFRQPDLLDEPSSSGSPEGDAFSNNSEEMSRHSVASSEVENAKSSRKKNDIGETDSLELGDGEDLTQSVELFPFGTDSYL